MLAAQSPIGIGISVARILLLETDVLYARILSDYLSQHDYQVDWVQDAQAAIHAADTCAPDIVIMELLLGLHNGVEFLQEFRSYSDWQHVPVLVITHVPPDAHTQALTRQLGVKQYIHKSTARLSDIERYVAGIIAHV